MARKNSYPEKQTLNLVIKDRPPHYYRVLALSLLFGLLFFSVFAKFAVLDRFGEANRLANEAVLTQARYERLLEENASFWEVRAEYEKYFAKVHEDEAYVDSMDVLLLIERNLMEGAAVQTAALSGNVLSVVLTGINLEQAAVIVSGLYENALVSSVTLSSADTTIEGIYSSVSMSIALVPPGEEAQ